MFYGLCWICCGLLVGLLFRFVGLAGCCLVVAGVTCVLCVIAVFDFLVGVLVVLGVNLAFGFAVVCFWAAWLVVCLVAVWRYLV